MKEARLAGKKFEEPEEKAEEKAAEEPAEPVTLTSEEKAIVFRKRGEPDMLQQVVAKCFGDFSLPARSEGFDAIDFLWQSESSSSKHLQDFILQKKLSSRVDTL